MNRRWKGVVIAAAFVAGAGCDVPTQPPEWDQTWVVPGEEITMSVGELLPGSVTLTPDSSAFDVTIDGVNFSQSLSTMCPACGIIDGQVVPKPAFTTTVSSVDSLPADVVSATLAGGQLVIDMTHDFGFDPLRPVASDPTVTGYVVVTVASGGVPIARDSVDGADADGAFPSGTTKTLTMDITPGDLDPALDITVDINSPAGDPYTVNSSAALSVVLQPSSLLMSAVQVTVNSVAVDTDPTTLDLAGVDSTVVDRVLAGAIRFNIDNPIDITGTLALTLAPPFGLPVQKSVSIAQGTSTERVEFTGNELRSILGKDNVQVTASGTVGSTGGAIQLTPDLKIVLSTDIELQILIGGEVTP